MGRDVKNSSRRARGTTRISSKHQVTIPLDAFVEAGLQPGDRVAAEAAGPGRVVLTRQMDLLDEFSGVLRSGGELGRSVAGLRDEWR